jgi:RimJ/RimL family protein N-acetyltransferase
MPTLTPAWPLDTERLRLRSFEPDDSDAMHEIYSDAGVVRYLYEAQRTRAEVAALVAQKRANTRLSSAGDGLSAAVVLRESGRLVGDVSLLWISESHRQAELGFVMHPSWHGRGYATEAARPMLAFAFEVVGVHRVIGRTEARNVGSARVLEKLGMRREAHLVENEWVKDEWQSELVYAILDREWRDARPGP